MYFDEQGWRIPFEGMRVFGEKRSNYYKLEQPEINYEDILERSKKNNICPVSFTVKEFETKAKKLLEDIKKNKDFSNLINGVHIPFVSFSSGNETDLGSQLENYLLPNLKTAFLEKHPESHFKAVLQSNAELKNNLLIDENSRYGKFIKTCSNKVVVGWYFPQAVQEYDISSQRKQMLSLPQPDEFELCLSGSIDICSAVIGSPSLLINKDDYCPILCMSSLEHKDKRLTLILKSYGPHMEFWLLTNMLTPLMEQVSEQWTGGLSIY